MYPVSPQAYDRAITVFSPDGRLFQVEYAREAVKRGTTALGLVYKNGVLLGIDKNVTTRLLKGESIEKIFQIDEHVAEATCSSIWKIFSIDSPLSSLVVTFLSMPRSTPFL